MIKETSLAVIGLVLALTGSARAADCGGETACRVPLGDYRIALPEGSPKGAYLFFHGYKSSALLQMQHRELIETVLKHGLAFIAVDGRDGVWSLPNLPEQGRDDAAFIDQVVADVGQRFRIEPRQMVVGGFSLGASAAWYTVCREGHRFAAAVTFSGTFWDPLPKPKDCDPGIPPFIQFHGTADQTFPLEGRALGDGFRQGNTVKAFEVIRSAAACGPKRETQEIAGLSCDTAPGCARGPIALCLHQRGHEINPVLLDQGLTQLGF